MYAIARLRALYRWRCFFPPLQCCCCVLCRWPRVTGRWGDTEGPGRYLFFQQWFTHTVLILVREMVNTRCICIGIGICICVCVCITPGTCICVSVCITPRIGICMCVCVCITPRPIRLILYVDNTKHEKSPFTEKSYLHHVKLRCQDWVLGASYIMSNYDVTERLGARSVPLTSPLRLYRIAAKCITLCVLAFAGSVGRCVWL